MRIYFSFLLIINALAAFSQAPLYYFPPKTGTVWQTLPPSQLGFCPERIDSLYRFLGERKTKGFLLLKNGRIVLEKYFGTFTQDSVWYWASAGKTATAFLVGQAQEQGILNIEKPTSDYLGASWTSCPPDKEKLITVRHQLTMTTGLDDNMPPLPGIPDMDNCTDPQCLTFKSDAGTRWAYHNAPYRLLHDVLAAASGKTINQYSNTTLFSRIGMKALWVDHVLYSTPRTMARFGLLLLAKGVWDGEVLLADNQYFQAMTNTSQKMNPSYGYLTWLNGKESFMLPSLQLVFPGELIPNAPDDMISGLGKNDQKIHVVPSRGWVVVRMGEDAGAVGPGGGQVPIVFDNELWKYLETLVCNPSDVDENIENQTIAEVFPNPTNGGWHVRPRVDFFKMEIFDAAGNLRWQRGEGQTDGFFVPADGMPEGVYFLKIFTERGSQVVKLVIHQD